MIAQEVLNALVHRVVLLVMEFVERVSRMLVIRVSHHVSTIQTAREENSASLSISVVVEVLLVMDSVVVMSVMPMNSAR